MIKKIYLTILVSYSLANPEASPEASPKAYASDYGYFPSSAPSSQYHAQDDAGQYNYGFSSVDQTKSEIKTADGITRGAYSYVDANGIVQSVQYISDALGFRVAATNLPVHNVETQLESAAVAPAALPVAQAATPIVASPVHNAAMTPNVDYAYLPYAQGYNYYLAPSQPATYVAQTVAHVAPTVARVAPTVAHVAQHVVQAVAPEVTGTQYHAQDEAGQYSFGYNDQNSVRQEVKTADGVVRGAYRYVDTDGVLQTVEYIADASGFRVAASNLPQGTVQVPISVEDTPEVAAAKERHAQAFAEAYSLPQPIVQVPVAVHDTPEVEAAKIEHAEAYSLLQEIVQVPVHDTPEVAAAKIAHAKAYAQAHAAAAVQPEDLSLYDTPAVEPITYVQEPVETLIDLRGINEVPTEYAQHVLAPVPVAQTAPVLVQTAYAPTPIVHAAQDGSQFHAQDDLGQYNYGYSDGNSAKQEVKTADGVTRGSYKYIDANGIVQTVNYISDALGFRVGATNLPVHIVDTPVEDVVDVSPVPTVSVAAAPLPVVPASYAQQKTIEPQVSYAYLPYASNYGYTLPETVVAGAAVDGTNSQFHAQDDLGQYNYGFSHPTQTKQELRTADGVTRGGYSYIDANGIVQNVNYISDAMGFRVAATNLPVHEVNAPVAPAVNIAPAVAAAPAVDIAPAVAVTPAVATSPIATAYHREDILTPQVQYAYLPYAANYGYHHTPSTYKVNAAPTRPVSSLTPTYYGAAATPVQATHTPFTYHASPVVQAASVVEPVVQSVAAPITYIQEPIEPLEEPTEYSQHVPVQTAPIAYTVPVVQAAPLPVIEDSQYHAQDDFGQYSFGYNDGNSVKQEVKTADGVVRGAYSYVDADGLVQHVNYIADALGFRVGATNLPVHEVDTPVNNVAEAVPSVAAPIITPDVSYAYLPYASNYGYSVPEPLVAPVVAQVAQVAQVAPVAPVAPVVAPIVTSVAQPLDTANSQYHAQDDIGQYNYGYSDLNSAKQELKTADGVTRGSYSYIDANGLVQTVNYISDAMGFRVAATNLPVHEVEGHGVETVVEPQVAYSYLPYAQNYGYTIPVNTAAAA